MSTKEIHRSILPVTDLQKLQAKDGLQVAKDEATTLGYQALAKTYRDQLGIPIEGSPSSGILKDVKDLYLTKQYLKVLGQMDQTESQPQAQTAQQSVVKTDPIVQLADTMSKLGANKEEVLGFLTKLPPEVLAAMYTAGESNPMVPLLLYRGHTQEPDQLKMKDVLELWKMNPGQQQQGGVEAMATMMTMMMKMMMERQDQRPQQPQTSPLDMLNMAKALLEPMYQTLSGKEQQVFSAQLETVKSQIVNPTEWLKSIKDTGKELGLVEPGQGSGETNLELEKMRMDQRRFEAEERGKADERMWEHERWKAEQGLKSKQTGMILKLIGDNLLGANGPVKKMLDAAAETGEDRIRDIGKTKMRREDIEGIFPCPNCAKEGRKSLLPVQKGVASLTCPNCNSVFARNGTPQSPPSTPNIQSAPPESETS